MPRMPRQFSAALLAIIGFAVQVYCDFSGYTDMAIGLAAMPRNKTAEQFPSALHRDLDQRPVAPLAHDPDALSRRLHLSAAVHDAGTLPVRRRVGKWPMFLLAVVVPVNVTFLVSGIWHGAGWNFIAFGVFTGIAMTVEFSWRRAAMPKLPKAAAWL